MVHKIHSGNLSSAQAQSKKHGQSLIGGSVGDPCYHHFLSKGKFLPLIGHLAPPLGGVWQLGTCSGVEPGQQQCSAFSFSPEFSPHVVNEAFPHSDKSPPSLLHHGWLVCSKTLGSLGARPSLGHILPFQ